MDATPFLDPSDLDDARQAIRDGLATVQALQDPTPVVTLQRRDPGSGAWLPVTLVPMALISLRLGERQEESAGANAGLLTRATEGELAGWAPLDIRRDDRFTWQDRAFVVGEVLPARFGVVRATIRLAS